MTDPRRLIDEGGEFERELLRAGRRDRISSRSKAAILGSLGVTAPLPFAVNDPTQAVNTSTAATKALMLKLAAGTLGALGLATGVYLSQSSNSPERLEQKPAISAPTVVERDAVPQRSVIPESTPSVPLPAAESVPLIEKAADVAPEPRVVPREAKGAHQADSIARELEHVEGARSALRAGDAARSLRLLNEYKQRYPRGNLRTEATVLRIEALAASGESGAATRLGKQFLAQAPNGPYARRIRSLLAQTAGSQTGTQTGTQTSGPQGETEPTTR